MNSRPMVKAFRSMFAACTVAALTVPMLSGCGGGVAIEPTVAIKRDKSGSASPETGSVPKADGASAAAPAAGGGGVGSWTGKVVIEGNAPALALLHKKGDPVRDAEVCAAADLPDERLVVGDGRGVANVFVFLPKAPAGASVSPPPSEEIIFDQKNCKFTPHALLLRAGQKMLIKTSDKAAHNTHTYPKRNSALTVTVPEAGFEAGYPKAEAEPIEVKCDFHTWMIAYHFPIDHQFAALSGADGSFEIKDLPAGEHKFRVWHEGCDGKYLSRSFSVTIKPGETTALDIPYPSSKLAL